MSAIHIEVFNAEAQYEMIASWWEHHRMQALPAALLPPLGHVVCFEGKPVAACWAYMDNGGTGVALLGWIVSNPDAPNRVVYTSLAELVQFTLDRLKALNYRAVFCSLNVPGLVKMFESMGFVAGDTGSTHLIKPL